MDGVINGLRYAPKYDDVVVRPCPRPPPKAALIFEIENLLKEQKKPSLGDCSKRKPDLFFLKVCLSTLKKDHKFFAKNYMPPPRPSKKKKQVPKLVLPHGFAFNMPPLNDKMIRAGSSNAYNKLVRLQMNRGK